MVNLFYAGLAFWKAPRRKVYAIEGNNSIEGNNLKITKKLGKRKRAESDDELEPGENLKVKCRVYPSVCRFTQGVPSMSKCFEQALPFTENKLSRGREPGWLWWHAGHAWFGHTTNIVHALAKQTPNYCWPMAIFRNGEPFLQVVGPRNWAWMPL